MRLTIVSTDTILLDEVLSQGHTIVEIAKKSQGLFVEWDEKNYHQLDAWILFAVAQRIPVIVFDKFRTMKEQEISKYVSKGVFLWEPAITGRMFFSYQPVWGNLYTKDTLNMFNTDRRVDLGYTNKLAGKMTAFEKYYKPIADYGTHSVAYFDTTANSPINDKIAAMGVPVVVGQCDYSIIKSTVLLGTKKDYNDGHLDPNIFTYLENGVVPLLPEEHRWYGTVFNGLTVKNTNDIEYLLASYDSTQYGCVLEVYERLNRYLPECDVKNVVGRIKDFFE